MTVLELQTHLQESSKDLSREFKRLFHGRGGLYEGWNFLTIDSIDTILSVAFYAEIQEELESELIEMLKSFISTCARAKRQMPLRCRHKTIALQRRYLKKAPTEIIVGELGENLFVVENGMKIKVNLLSNQNSGYFPDMKKGREFVNENAKEKKVLNLFSYTCSFSIAAVLGGACSVSNIDMSKGALSTGRENHHLNGLETKNASFSPYNILKSLSGIKKKGPYDLIIIDPPSFQRGSFEAAKDYEKIIKKLEQMASQECLLLACLNSPNLDSNFLIELIKKFAPSFEFVKRLENLPEFANADEERSLKNLVFRRVAL